MPGVFRPDVECVRDAATRTRRSELLDHARSVGLVHAGDAEKHTPRIADGRREAHPLHAQIRVTGNGHGRTRRGDGDLAERFCFHWNQSQARILYFALVVTVTFTLVASWVPSVTVKMLELPDR